jgi:hypothetical protein
MAQQHWKKGFSVKDDNINSIFTYMRLCAAPHNFIYVATSVMFSCLTKHLSLKGISNVIDHIKPPHVLICCDFGGESVELPRSHGMQPINLSGELELGVSIATSQLSDCRTTPHTGGCWRLPAEPKQPLSVGGANAKTRVKIAALPMRSSV